MGGRRLRVSLLASLTLAAILTSCAGRSDVAVEPLARALPVPPSGSELLPAPAELLAHLGDAPRRAAYVEADLIRHGAGYQPLLPENRVMPTAGSAGFDPKWSVAEGLGPEQLAYCTYEFNIPGYDRAPEIRYGWTSAPDDCRTAWFGLSEWSGDRWHWVRGEPDQVLALPSFAPYLDGDTMLVLVLLACDDTCRLRWLRLGPLQLTAGLQISPPQAVAPVEIAADASSSQCPAGTISRHEWDWDGDGLYDHDTGVIDNAVHTYTDAGQYTARVRLTSSFGVQATAGAPVAVKAPWVHTWGKAEGEVLYGIAHDGAESVFAVGSIEVFGNAEDLLLLKYDLEGNLIWARSWGGTEPDCGRDVACGADGALYVVGDTESFGVGDSDVFLQRWDGDGNLAWTHTWGGDHHDRAKRVAYSGGAVYLLGNTTSFDPPEGDVLLLKYDTDGVSLWAHTVGDMYEDTANDMHAQYNLLGGTTTIHVVGTTPADWPADESILYVKFNHSGELTRYAQFIGGINEDTMEYEDHTGTCIVASGMLDTQVYIGGVRNTNDIVLLRVDNGGLVWSTSWNGGNIERATGVLLAEDRVVLCGYGIDGLLFSFATDHNLQAVQAWDNSGGYESFHCMERFPGGGVLLGGVGAAASGGSWSTPVGSALGADGSWHEDLSPDAPGEPIGIIDDIPDAPVDITDGVIDTGGGGDDALLAAKALP